MVKRGPKRTQEYDGKGDPSASHPARLDRAFRPSQKQAPTAGDKDQGTERLPVMSADYK